jgi:hypothetical protein
MLKLPVIRAAALTLISAFWLSSTPIRADPFQVLSEGSAVSAGHVLICDTPQELEAFLNKRDGDVAARVVAVNSFYGTESCTVVTVAFVKQFEAKVVLVPNGIVRIIKVNVVGIETQGGWTRFNKPLSRYLGVLEDATMV